MNKIASHFQTTPPADVKFDDFDRISLPHTAAGPRAGVRFKTCYLHIGTEKTGSTSIQRFLWLNRHYLALLGYFVPESLAPHAADGYLNHIFATTSSQIDTSADDAAPQGAVQFAAHRRATQNTLAAEIAARGDRCDSMIISNEHLHSRLREIEDVRRLKALLDASSDDYRVIVYLRPQHEIATSLLGTALKNGLDTLRLLPQFDTFNGFDAFLGVDHRYFDYFDLLARFAYVFGKDRVEPRIYVAHELQAGNVVDDFVRLLGLDMAYLRRPARENPNISAAAQYVMLRLNIYLKDKTPDVADEIRTRVRDALVTQFPGRGMRPTRAAAQAFQRQFDRSNEAVRQHWFADQARLFTLDFSDYAETESVGAQDAAAIAARVMAGYEDIIPALGL